MLRTREAAEEGAVEVRTAGVWGRSGGRSLENNCQDNVYSILISQRRGMEGETEESSTTFYRGKATDQKDRGDTWEPSGMCDRPLQKHFAAVEKAI